MLRSSAVAVLILVIAAVGAADDGVPPTLDLMPVPATLELGSGSVAIDDGFTAVVEGPGAGPRLERAVGRMLRRLSDRTTLFFPTATFLDLRDHAEPILRVRAARVGELRLGEDESYRLTAADGRLLIEAETDVGALRGLETLLQLLVLDGDGIRIPEVVIDDAPRFPWRGLMLDSSRHFMPLEVIERNLDGMAAVKLNVLHWHLVDDQGVRLESLALPKLHELGSDGLYYTRAEIREVIDFAADRGIRVVPEFDLPGHATAWLTAYPELASAPGPYRIERRWGTFDPTVNPILERTYDLLGAFFVEMAALFDDEYIHIGGDDVDGEQWLANPEVAAVMEANGYTRPLELQRGFNERVFEILTRAGKRMVGWDEILQEGLPTGIVIQSRRGRGSLDEAAVAGHSAILSAGYSIDLVHRADRLYLNDPLPAGTALTDEQAARILGGEAILWTEYVSPETVDSRIWPRTAAIAERLWSPRPVRDLDDMYRRLDRVSLMLEELGLQHERNRPAMLRRLCRCRDLDDLEVLLGAIEPVTSDNRGRLRTSTQFSPLTRMADAAWPDPTPARELGAAVDRLAAADFDDAGDLATVRAMLETWRDNDAAVAPVLAGSPGLVEMLPISAALTEVSVIGLEALDVAAHRRDVTRGWVEDRLEALDAARTSHGQAELVVVDPVQTLVCGAAGRLASRLEGCRPAEDESAAER